MNLLKQRYSAVSFLYVNLNKNFQWLDSIFGGGSDRITNCATTITYKSLYNISRKDGFLFFYKMGQPRPLYRLFLVFSYKHYKFLQQIYVKKCPTSIRCPDSNPQPSECESPPITTRPGLPPRKKIIILIAMHPNGAYRQLHFYCLHLKWCYFVGLGLTVNFYWP